MKGKTEFVIVYDDQCPLCAAYSNWFVKWKWIDSAHRIPFSEMDERKLQEGIDIDRARNEIPVMELRSGKVFYGVEGLSKIIGQKFYWVEKLAAFPPVSWLLKRIYKLISYNRRVIVPAKSCNSKYDCAPDFNLRYRVFFLLFAVIVSLLITFLFGFTSNEMLGYSKLRSGIYFLLIAGTGWILQMILSGLLGEKAFDYMGHLGVIMVAGVLILVPSIIVNLATSKVFLTLTIISLACSGTLMFMQHKKRARLLGISKWWNAVWLVNLYGGAVFWIFTLKIF